MSDYIEREAAIMYAKLIVHTAYERSAKIRDSEIIKAMNGIPAADVVEVVRCKDCRWGKEACGNIECFADLNAPTEYHGYEWFCPNGEMRGDT